MKKNDKFKDQEKSSSKSNENRGQRKSQRGSRSRNNNSRKDFDTKKTRDAYPGSTNQGCYLNAVTFSITEGYIGPAHLASPNIPRRAAR